MSKWPSGFCMFLILKKETKGGISSLLGYVSDSWGVRNMFLVWVRRQTDPLWSLFLIVSILSRKYRDFQFCDLRSGTQDKPCTQNEYLDPWPSLSFEDRPFLPMLKLPAVTLFYLPKEYAGKWGKSSPSRRDNHQQSVLKVDDAEFLLSPAVLVQCEQRYKTCLRPKQSLQKRHLYHIPERIFPEVVKLKGLMLPIHARKGLLTV